MGSVFSFDDFELDVDKSELRRDGEPVKVDALILRLLEVFVRSPGKLITKSDLVSFAWDSRVVSDNSLAVAIWRLRKVLEGTLGPHDAVLTVHGRGYRFLRAVSTREAPSSSAPPRAGTPASSSPFVGREQVIAHLKTGVLAAQGGSGAVIVLSGDGGIGKTRVAEMIADEASEIGLLQAWGYCREVGNTPPLWPILALLREVTERLGPALTSDARFQALLPELAVLLPELAVGREPPSAARAIESTSKHRVFDAVARALTLAAEQQPLLLVIDDLHRADEASLELLQYLLPAVPRTRIMLLATLRNVREDGGAPSPALARVLGHRNCTRIPLPPLSQEHVAIYLAALFGDVDDGLVRTVYEISEGSPFYMVELTLQLRHSPQRSASSLKIPNVALELVRQRLSRLEQPTQEVLTCCAIIGRAFSLPLLQAILGDSANDLMERLDEAIASEVIKPGTKSALEFEFTHDLLRAVLYESLGPAERRSWHLRVAQILDRRRALAEVPITDLADHAWRALPEGNLRKTVDYCMEAAGAARRVYAVRDAARFMQHAREALELIDGASPRLRFGLLFRQAAIVRPHSTREFVPLAEQLLRLAREQGEGLPLAHASLLLDPFPGFPRLPVLKNALSDALQNLPADAPSVRPALMARLASSVPRAYDAAASGDMLAEALQLAAKSPEIGDSFSARFGELYLYGGPAHQARAAAAMVELQRLWHDNQQSGPPLPPLLLDLHRAITAFQAGRLAAAAHALERCESSARELACELLWYVQRSRALLRVYQGDVADAGAVLHRLHCRARSDNPIVGAELFCAYDETLAAGSGPRQGDSVRAFAPDAYDPPNIWALKVRALTAAGSLDEARTALGLVPAEKLRRLPCDREYLGTLGALARAALSLGADGHARVLYDLLKPYPEYFAVNLSFVCEGSVSQLLGMLACSFGERERAREHLELAIAASEKAGLKLSAADAQRELERG